MAAGAATESGLAAVRGTRLLVVGLLLGGLIGVAPARAATITYTDTAPLSGVEVAGVLSVSRFDDSLGTLTGVSFSITGAIASLLGIQNDGNGTVSPSALTNVDFDVDAAELSLSGTPDFNAFATTGTVTLNVGESVLFPLTSQSTITNTEAPSAAFLLPGTIDLSYATVTSFGANSAGGDLTISQASDAGISFSITYEYAVVPEPGTLALVALGLAGIARVRRGTPRV